MGKKKVKDFNKVKLKLGKVLKKQNETIVDLTKKKIFLPKVKEYNEKHIENKENITILDEHIKRMQTANDEIQQRAIASIQSILYPYASQLSSEVIDHKNYSSKESSIKLLSNLFGIEFSNQDFNFQVGDLLHCLNRMSQNSQNAKLPLEIAKLCRILITIFSYHPRMHTVLICIDRIASSLLKRPEPWWRLGGFKILSNLSDARNNIMISLAFASESFIFVEELQALTDINYQLYRTQTYLRLLVRHFESLNEVATIDAKKSRMSLLMASMSFLKDCQYTQYMTPMSFCNAANKLNIHPYLTPVKIEDTQPGNSVIQPGSHVTIQSTWMLSDSEFIGGQDASGFVTGYSVSAPAGKGSKSRRIGTTGPTGDSVAAWNDRKLAICIVNEGLRCIDDLVHAPKVETIFGLIYVLRSLRVFAEIKGAAFFLPKLPDKPALPDVSAPLNRFCTRLSELVPLDMSDDDLLCSEMSTPDCKTPTSASANLTRKDQKRVQKRAAKSVRRGDNQEEPAPMDTSNAEEEEEDLKQASPVAKKCTRSMILTHILKQAIVQLWFSFALLDGDGARKLKIRDQNPLKASDGMLRELAAFLLANDEGEGDGGMVRPLSGLSSLSPALAWRWLRIFDHCILYHHRMSCNRQPSQEDKIRLASFIAPMLMTIFKDFHGWCLRHRSSSAAAATDSARIPRSIVRAAGLLTAFFSRELHNLAWFGCDSALSKCPKTEAGFVYDSSWINESLIRLDQQKSVIDDVLATFIQDLHEIIVNRIDTLSLTDKTNILVDLPSNWLWAVVCLSNLIDNQCSSAVLAVSGDSMEASSLRLLITLIGDQSVMDKLRFEEPLVFLSSPLTGRYSTPKAWRCTPITSILAQDAISS